jgi:ABC-2 type transport system permease protein
VGKLLAIYARELRYYFQSITAYVTMAVFLLLSGYFFFSIFRFYTLLSYQAARNPEFTSGLNLVEGIMRPLFNNISIIMLLVLPLLTMRLIAEERRQGTFELLLTYPVTDAQVVLGKFLAAVSVFTVMIATTFLYPLILEILADPEWGAMLTGYSGIFLVGCTFIAMGVFFSSVTDSQLIAGVLTFGLALFFLIIGWAVPFVGPRFSSIIAQFSLLQHFGSFAKGIIATQDIGYYLFLSIFFIFLSIRSLESTRWRS